MRLLKFLVFICIVGLLFQIFAVINLKASYKSEVDIMETHIEISKMSSKEKNKEFQRIAVIKKEISKQRFVAKVLFWLFLVGLTVSGTVLYRRM